VSAIDAGGWAWHSGIWPPKRAKCAVCKRSSELTVVFCMWDSLWLLVSRHMESSFVGRFSRVTCTQNRPPGHADSSCFVPKTTSADIRRTLCIALVLSARQMPGVRASSRWSWWWWMPGGGGPARRGALVYFCWIRGCACATAGSTADADCRVRSDTGATGRGSCVLLPERGAVPCTWSAVRARSVFCVFCIDLTGVYVCFAEPILKILL
jgi:hypothetical protein